MNDAYTRWNVAADVLLSRPDPDPRHLKRLERCFLTHGLPVPTDLTARLLEAGYMPDKRTR